MAPPAAQIRHDDQKTQGGKFEGEPTYKADYKKWDMSGRPGPYVRKDEWVQPIARFEGETTMNHDYRKNAQPPRQSMKPQEASKLSDAPFADNTGYRQSYQPYTLGPKFVREREQYKAPGVPFDGVTTFKRDYRGPIGELTKSFKPDNQAFSSGQPLEDLTTNRKDYIKHAQPPRQSIKPQEASKLSDAPFADNTGYRQSYQPHILGPKFVREREQYKAPGVPFEGVTTFKRDYRGTIGELTKSFKPDNQAFSSGQPLEDLTTNRKDYIKYPASKPYVHVHEGYKKPEGDMFMQTTHQSTYRQLPWARNAMIRPTDAGKVSNGPFDGTTNYAQNYKQWQVRRVEQTAREGYHPNNAPFEGMSTQKAHFIPQGMVENRSFKPDNTAFQSYANTM